MLRQDGARPEAGLPGAGCAPSARSNARIALVEHGDADHVDRRPRRLPSPWPSRRLGRRSRCTTRATSSATPSLGRRAAARVDAERRRRDRRRPLDRRLARRRAGRLLAEHAVVPDRGGRRAANGGLPVARNTGFRRARGARTCSRSTPTTCCTRTACDVLADHLDAAPADVVAAYGLLERFDETGSLGLTSHLPWDPDLLVRGAFIDAMAMFRKAAWSELGGYADDPGTSYGWEDYDLWLPSPSVAAVPTSSPGIVGRYREQPGFDAQDQRHRHGRQLRHPPRTTSEVAMAELTTARTSDRAARATERALREPGSPSSRRCWTARTQTIVGMGARLAELQGDAPPSTAARLRRGRGELARAPRHEGDPVQRRPAPAVRPRPGGSSVADDATRSAPRTMRRRVDGPALDR